MQNQGAAAFKYGMDHAHDADARLVVAEAGSTK
jgi:hypothetical protein